MTKSMINQISKKPKKNDVNIFPDDKFGPVNPITCISIPEHSKVIFIGKPEEIESLKDLIGKPLIGMD